jgi:hypothetical protein
MRAWLCDFCDAKVISDAAFDQRGWLSIWEAEQPDESSMASVFGHSTRSAKLVATFCSMSCLARFAEMKAIETGTGTSGTPEVPKKKGWRK